jgi:hypothetical protein
MNWLHLLKRKSLRPIISLVESVAADDYEKAEKKWIAHCRSIGCDLVNATDGGEGGLGRKHSPEEIAKRVNSRRGYRHSEATRKKISDANKGQVPWTSGKSCPPETREKIRLALLGHLVTTETRLKIGKKSRGRKASLETRMKMSKAHLGKKHTEESKAKMRGRRVSEETREKMRMARRRVIEDKKRSRRLESSDGLQV